MSQILLRFRGIRICGSQHGPTAAQNDVTSDSARTPYLPPPFDARLPASSPTPLCCSTRRAALRPVSRACSCRHASVKTQTAIEAPTTCDEQGESLPALDTMHHPPDVT